MRKLQTEILVIGGGSTGTGLARDLAMRGFKTTLVERYGLSDGTTTQYHGLLHSGGRYVVTDPEAAKECVQENRILRRILPHGIDDTGGFFVLMPGDDLGFVETFLSSSRRVGMPVESVPVEQMLREEPRLNPQITHCFWVSDAVSYAYIATQVTALSAQEYGASILTHHEVINIVRQGDRVIGAVCKDHSRDEQVTILADMIVSATGPSAGKIASLADVNVGIIPGKGTMVSVEHIPLKTVINRCRQPSDGDIIVPKKGEAIVGTTDIEIDDPEKFGVTGEEISQMLAAGEALIPGYSRAANIRAWAGVRPLFKNIDGEASDNRKVSRTFALLDHAQRDGVEGFITITGGKWTTHRLMAQHTADMVCRKLGVERPCRTHLEVLPEFTAEFN